MKKVKMFILVGVFLMVFVVGAMAAYTCSEGMSGSHAVHQEIGECFVEHAPDIARYGGGCDYHHSGGYVYYRVIP